MPWSCNRKQSIGRPGLVFASLFWALAIAVISPWSIGGPVDTSAQDGPVFNALMLDGRTQSGRLVSLGPGAIALTSAEGAKHELPLNQVFKLTRDVAGPVAAIDRSMIVLPEGDCLMRVTLGTASETALDVQSDTLGKLAVPLDCLLGTEPGDGRCGVVERVLTRQLVQVAEAFLAARVVARQPAARRRRAVVELRRDREVADSGEIVRHALDAGIHGEQLVRDDHAGGRVRRGPGQVGREY